jgi:hypothetical protein
MLGEYFDKLPLLQGLLLERAFRHFQDEAAPEGF